MNKTHKRCRRQQQSLNFVPLSCAFCDDLFSSYACCYDFFTFACISNLSVPFVLPPFPLTTSSHASLRPSTIEASLPDTDPLDALQPVKKLQAKTDDDGGDGDDETGILDALYLRPANTSAGSQKLFRGAEYEPFFLRSFA